MTNYLRSFRHLSRDVYLFLLAWGLVTFAYAGIQAVLLNLYLLRLGYGPEFIGLLNGMGTLIWAIVALPAGAIGARWGLRQAMVVGIIFSLIGGSMILLVESLPQNLRTGWLLGWTVVRWASPALLLVNRNPYLMEVTGRIERGHAFALQQVTMAIMGLLGSLVAGVIPGFLALQLGHSVDQPDPYRLGLWLAPIVYAMAALVLLQADEVRLPKAASVQAEAAKAPVGLILFFGLLTLIVAFGEGALLSFFNIYLDDGLGLATVQIGFILGIGQFLRILSGSITPVLLNRWGSLRAFWVGSIGTMLSLAAIGLMPRLPGATLGFSGSAIMIAIAAIARNLASQEAVSAPWRSAMSAGMTVGMALGWASAAFLGGYWILVMGYSSLFLLAASLSLLGSAVLFGYIRFYARRRT